MIENRLRGVGYVVLLLGLTWGCGGSTPAAPADAVAPGGDGNPWSVDDKDVVSLVDHDVWQVVTGDDDPFAALVAADAACDPDAGYRAEYFGEEYVFSIDTAFCNALTVMQPTTVSIAAGERLRTRIWHFSLTADKPAEAYVAIALGDDVIMDETLPIPSGSGLSLLTWTASESVPDGTPIYFHVHNHGDNSWSFIELSKIPPSPEP
jgi:hypothetical protein